MHVSYGELIRISPESIRMLGFTFGQADDCVEGFVWTECVLGRGYTLMRMADQRRVPEGWPAPSIRDDGRGTTVVGLRETPVFALGARLADLAVCEVSQSGSDALGLVVAHGGFGGWIAPYVALRITRNGYDASVIWRPGPPTVKEEAPVTLVSGRAVEGGGDEPLLIAPGPPYAAPPRGEGIDAIRQNARLGSRLGDAVAEFRDKSIFAVIAAKRSTVEPRTYLVPDLHPDDAIPKLTEAGILDVEARLNRAIHAGIEVERDDHAIMTRLSINIRLPNSERSRAQAG